MQKHPTLRFFEWQSNPSWEAASFSLDPPDGGTAYASLTEWLRDLRPNGPDRLLNQDAPNLALQTIHGNTLSLSNVSTDRIAMIVFWSSRSGPSHVTLPIVQQIQSEFADRITVYAVNVGDSQDQVCTYLEKNDIALIDSVLLDTESKAAKAYAISGLPQIFMVDHNGKVSQVYRGFSSNLKQRLSQDLTETVNALKLRQAKVN